MKCIVFTHFGRQRNNPLVTTTQKVNQQEEWQERLRAYRGCNNVDLIYIFIMDGYVALVSRGDIPFKELMIERTMRNILETAARVEGLSDKVQVVGIDELIPTLAALQDIAESRNQDLDLLLLGGGRYAYYDSPKMVEAFIRLARGTHIETDEVILRFDEDVFVNRGSIQKLINFHNKLPYGKNKNEYRFLSGNYRFHKPEDLLNDFAIRTHFFSSVGARKLSPGDAGYKDAKHWLDSIAEIGADPYNQVISGAGLTMSLRSISTLPPFANAGSPILWIDDHLKRRLHEALEHLPPPPAANSKSVDKSYRCCHQANFKQDRHPDRVTQGDIDWVIQYLPRFVRGIVMDNLIWDRHKRRAGVYINFVNEVTNGGSGTPELTLRKTLKSDAYKVLDKVETMWSDQCYKKYRVYDYAKNVLPGEKDILFNQVVEALHSYLTLLRIWQPFVSLWHFMSPTDEQNRWLYRKI
ncbi:MAG: hypothetical protein A2Y58_05045 [Chloroflexi bacterium RBG_13_51_52]|nr:MAG: hypothetical protein A2Y58_05045 [Chloroflexi bacterium RBG_13_51_52]